MLSSTLEKLEDKINQVIELVEWYSLQIEEAKQTEAELKKDHLALKQQQNDWEETIIGLLGKLEKLQLAEKDKHPQEAI